jgi:hypothetical protein
LADKSAKTAANATNLPTICPHYFSSKLSTKKIAKQLFAQNLHDNWNTLIIQRPSLNKYYNSYEKFQDYLKISHKLLFLTDVISGHVPTYAHLFRMNRSDGSACPVCLCEDNMEHWLFDCLKYSAQRKKMPPTTADFKSSL